MNKKDHQAEAESHIAQGANFAKLCDQLSTAADSMTANESGAEALRSASEVCKAVSDRHIADGSRHLDCAKAVAGEDELEKIDDTDEASDLKKLLAGVNSLLKQTVPTGVSAVPLFDNPRAVTRTGQPTEKERLEAQKAVEKVSPELSSVLFGREASQ